MVTSTLTRGPDNTRAHASPPAGQSRFRWRMSPPFPRPPEKRASPSQLHLAVPTKVQSVLLPLLLLLRTDRAPDLGLSVSSSLPSSSSNLDFAATRIPFVDFENFQRMTLKHASQLTSARLA